MTATRASWRFPDLRNGSTIAHVTDTHFGTPDWPAFAQNWLNRVQTDLEALKIAVDSGVIHTGDMINSYKDDPNGDNGTEETIANETSWYISWRDAIKASNGLPFAEAVGNHDLLGPFLSDGVSRTNLTSQQWAESLGLSQPNNVYDMGDVRILTIAPDTWPNETLSSYLLSDDTLSWLDEQLSESTKPVFVGCHVTLQEQYPTVTGEPFADTSNPSLTDLIGAHSNLIGWISGHRHILVPASPNHAEVISIGGRNIFAVNGPSAGGMGHDPGRQWGTSGTQNTCASIFMTLLDDDNLDIRWRNHLTNSWMSGPSGATQTHLLLTRS